VLESGQRAGALRDDIPTKYLSLLLFSLTNRTMLWYRPDGPLTPEQLGEMFAVMFLGGVAAPDQASKPVRVGAVEVGAV
jgi:hypothetical protein